MRTKPYHEEIKLLSPPLVIELLQQSSFGHLACHVKDDIYLVPFSFTFEDGYIYSHSRPGKKIEMMRQNPKVCVQVEKIQDFYNWKSVIAWGHFEELQDEEGLVAMRRLIKKMTEGEFNQRRSDLEVDFAAQLESSIIYRIKIEKSSGRYEDFDT